MSVPRAPTRVARRAASRRRSRSLRRAERASPSSFRARAQVFYLSYMPIFGLLTDTLTKAAPAGVGFLAVFSIVLIGFAQVPVDYSDASQKDLASETTKTEGSRL